MTPTPFFWLASLGLGLWCLCSLGVRLLYEIAWHDLKDHCLKRDERERFDAIHDGHDEVRLGMETLRTVSVVLLIVGGATWFMLHSQTEAFSGREIFWTITGLLVIALLGVVWLPGAVVAQWDTPLLHKLWPLLRVASFLAFPLAFGAIAMEKALRRMRDETEQPSDEEAFEDEVLAIVTEGMHDGHLEADAREMIEGVIELGDADVADIMTPRSKMDTISIGHDWDQVLEFVAQCGRTRIPVHDESVDEILGILYVKDLFAELANGKGRPEKTLAELLRKPWYVPPAQKLDDLLNDFRHTRNHLAVVRDEFSRTAGIVTIEDVLEEIVGEIVDETDAEQIEDIHRIDKSTAVIQGRTHLTEVNETMGLNLPEPEDFDTIAGYVITQLGHIPVVGEQLLHDSVRITVLQATKRKVEQVRLELVG